MNAALQSAKPLHLFLLLTVIAALPVTVRAADVRCDEIPDASISTDGIFQPPRADGPTLVDVALNIVEITGIDIRNGQFHFQAYVDFAWCDPREAFDAKEEGSQVLSYAGAAALSKQEKIWNTDLSMANEVSEVQVRKRELTIRYDGRVRLRGYFSAHLSAFFDLRRFPFDFQTLPIQVESLTWNEDILRLRVDPEGIGIHQDFELAEWEVGDVTGAVISVERGTSGVRFSRLEIATTIHRQVGYYLWKAILPLFLIVGLGWTVFWIPDGLATRIRLSATVMLTIVAYQFALSADLPKIAAVNLFSAYMILSFLIIAFTVAVNVFVFVREEKGDETIVKRSDRLCRWMIPSLYLSSVALVVFIYLG